MALAAVYKSAEQIGALYAPSLNAALREIEAESGVTARIKAPLGGARTKAECNALGTSWTISDHWEGRGRAVDIDNRGDVTSGIARRRGITFSAAVAVYYAIFAKHGWRNITTDGQRFPSEPWHLANHSSTPQSGTVTLLTLIERPDMELIFVRKSGAAGRYNYALVTEATFTEWDSEIPAQNTLATAHGKMLSVSREVTAAQYHLIKAEVVSRAAKLTVPGSAPSGPLVLSDSDVSRIAKAVIAEQKLPGN